jgi:N-6 DNA Methylase
MNCATAHQPLPRSIPHAKERRKKGAHYTTEKNILKVIGPLFLDDLKTEFTRLKELKRGRAQALEAFRQSLGKLTFLDPACGCGNFLIIAYRELRELELSVLRELNPQGQRDIGVTQISALDVDQFYGIEFEEFPALIAEVAMWMMDHIMNNQLSLEFGQTFIRIPLKKSPHIKHADALETDWNTLLPARECSYVLGNPPFIGQSYQSPAQRQQMAKVIGNKSGKAGSLDYVGAWFLKAGAYINQPSPALRAGEGARRADEGHPKTKIAFVSTNSITQGEQVAQLWPLLFDRYKLEIAFAHRTFAWGSEARGMAHVHVVILGLTRADMEPKVKRLFSYENIKGDPVESQHEALTAYLLDATNLKNRHIVVADSVAALSSRPQMLRGAQSTDNGYLIFRGEEKSEFLKIEPLAEKYLRPYLGAVEFLNSKPRWILFLEDALPQELRAIPLVAERVKKVREFRLASQKPATRRLGQTPTLLEGRTIPASTFLAIPQVSSERRQYVPFGWLSPPTIPSDKLRFIEHATLTHFGLLTSAMHMAWMRSVTGRMKSDYMYSVVVVYNTFPWPDMSPDQEAKISALAQAVLDARAASPDSTLADLYDPNLMPPNLRKAHQTLDLAVDRLYRKTAFSSERERVEHLFGLYEKMVAPLEAAAKAKPKRTKKA